MNKRRKAGYVRPLLAIILAGGQGTRLRKLTEVRCKPAVPFGGKNRLIDFALANVLNSRNVDRIMILTQYMQQDLIHHLEALDLNSRIWRKSSLIFPAQQQFGDDTWYGGTANAVYQNREYIARDPAEAVVILAADHIYKLDLQQVHACHRRKGSRFTVCGHTMPVAEAAGNFGVMELDADAKIVGFEEKPKEPKSMPGRDGTCFSSMGIYLIEKEYLLELLDQDHADPTSDHDFGKNIIPRCIASGEAIHGYDYAKNEIPGETIVVDGKTVQANYWKDVGRIGPYWEAVMDLVAVVPRLNLYNPEWPVPTAWDQLPPLKTVTPEAGKFFVEFGHIPQDQRVCTNFFASGGGIIDSPLRIYDSVLGRSIRTEYGAWIEKSILFDGARVGHHAHLEFAIVEEGVSVPPGARVGVDVDEDRRNGVYIDQDHDPSAWHRPIRIVHKDSFK